MFVDCHKDINGFPTLVLPSSGSRVRGLALSQSQPGPPGTPSFIMELLILIFIYYNPWPVEVQNVVKRKNKDFLNIH